MSDKNKKNLMWSISLMVIGVSAIILNGSNLLNIELPDIATRIIGIAELIALPFLIYSSVKILWKEKGGK